MNPAISDVSDDKSTSGIGWFVFYIRKAFTALYFLAIRNLRNFEFATQNEAIVDALWVRLCTLPSFS